MWKPWKLIANNLNYIYLQICKRKIPFKMYLFRRWLIFEKASLGTAHNVLVPIIRHRFDIIDGRAKQFVLQKTWISQTVPCRFAHISLLLARLWWIFVGLRNGGIIGLPIVICSAKKKWRKVQEHIINWLWRNYCFVTLFAYEVK